MEAQSFHKPEIKNSLFQRNSAKVMPNYLDLLPIDVILKIQPHLNLNDLETVISVSPVWRFVVENDTTWKKVQKQYIYNFRSLDSVFLRRMNVLDFEEYLRERSRLHQEEIQETNNELTSIVSYLPMRLVTGIKGLVNSYFTQTRERLVIFGPGMERGFINFLMWDCNSMGISTTVETSVTPRY